MINKVVSSINGPVNIIFSPKCSDFNELRQLGVNRLSVGSTPVRSVVAHIMSIAHELKNDESTTMTK